MKVMACEDPRNACARDGIALVAALALGIVAARGYCEIETEYQFGVSIDWLRAASRGSPPGPNLGRYEVRHIARGLGVPAAHVMLAAGYLEASDFGSDLAALRQLLGDGNDERGLDGLVELSTTALARFLARELDRSFTQEGESN